MDREIRTQATEIELRTNENETKGITGYAVKWEELSQEIGYFYKFREKFEKGAFKDSLEADTQRALWNHNTDIVLGNTKNNTLRLKEDKIGLRFDIDLPNNTWGNDVYESVQRGDVDGVSFGFKMTKEEWDETDPENVVRTVKGAKLFEVSPTPFPAYEGASEVSARSIDDPYKKYKEQQKEERQEPAENDSWFFSIRKKLNGGN